MADEADRAQAQLDALAPFEIGMSKKKEGPPPIGRCYFCEAPVDGAMRWCGDDCRNDWEYEQRRKREQGRG